MKKSLVVLIAIAVALAFTASAMAKGPAPACPVPMKCEMVGFKKPLPTPPPEQHAPGPRTPPVCKPVPVQQVISIPGKVAYGWKPVPVKVPKEIILYDVLCVGKAKGACPIGCCDKVTWNCSWETLRECDRVTVPLTMPIGMPPDWKPVQAKWNKKVTPIAPVCIF